MKWIIQWFQLSDQQQQIIFDIETGNDKIYWISGFAGTGKSFILVFLIKRYLKFSEGKVCFVTFTNALRDLYKDAFDNDELHNKNFTITNLYQFVRTNESYDIILFDEVQDIDRNELEIAIQKAKKKIIFAGDFDQSIYKNTIDIPDMVKNTDKIFLLQRVWRFSEKIKKIAYHIYPKSKIISSEAKDINLSKGSDIYFYKASSLQEEINGVMKIANKSPLPGAPCAILLPSHNLIQKFLRAYFTMNDLSFIFDQKNTYKNFNNFKRLKDLNNFNDFCDKNNIKLRYFGNGVGSLQDSDHKSLTYIMTYHSSKGLEFYHTILPFIDDSLAGKSMRCFANNDMNLFQRIFYVAVTRSQADISITCHSTPNKLFSELIENNLAIESSFSDMDTTDKDDEDDDLF